MRMALEFAKKGMTQYISHLDLQRAFGRAIRRSGLPVKLSQGFNPHYVMSFASALALGTQSECECVEMALAEEISPEAFLAAMTAALPEGLAPRRAVRLGDGAPKLMAALREAEYTAETTGANMDEINAAICGILGEAQVCAVKHSKGKDIEFDMRPMILGLGTDGDRIWMRLAAAQTGSLKPDFVIREIEKKTGAFEHRVTRTALLGHSGGKPADLLEACAQKEG